MKLRVFPDAETAAHEAAKQIAARVRDAVLRQPFFSLALSGGRSPQAMFDALARQEDIPWRSIHLFQVDERLVAGDSPERNFAGIRERLLARATIPGDQVHPMPVEACDPEIAAARYAATLDSILGPGGNLDLVHLGLGADGHTASLIPGDPASESDDRVVLSRPYQGTRRLSLGSSVLSAARERLWLVTGGDKRTALAALLAGDAGRPAGRIERRHSTVYADRTAASRVGPPQATDPS